MDGVEREALELSLMWWRRILLETLAANHPSLGIPSVRESLEIRHHAVLWGHEC